MSNVLTCTAKSSLGFRGAVELRKAFAAEQTDPQPGERHQPVLKACISLLGLLGATGSVKQGCDHG